MLKYHKQDNVGSSGIKQVIAAHKITIHLLFADVAHNVVAASAIHHTMKSPEEESPQ
jgi:hypothetical protein